MVPNSICFVERCLASRCVVSISLAAATFSKVFNSPRANIALRACFPSLFPLDIPHVSSVLSVIVGGAVASILGGDSSGVGALGFTVVGSGIGTASGVIGVSSGVGVGAAISASCLAISSRACCNPSASTLSSSTPCFLASSCAVRFISACVSASSLAFISCSCFLALCCPCTPPIAPKPVPPAIPPAKLSSYSLYASGVVSGSPACALSKIDCETETAPSATAPLPAPPTPALIKVCFAAFIISASVDFAIGAPSILVSTDFPKANPKPTDSNPDSAMEAPTKPGVTSGPGVFSSILRLTLLPINCGVPPAIAPKAPPSKVAPGRGITAPIPAPAEAPAITGPAAGSDPATTSLVNPYVAPIPGSIPLPYASFTSGQLTVFTLAFSIAALFIADCLRVSSSDLPRVPSPSSTSRTVELTPCPKFAKNPVLGASCGVASGTPCVRI